MENGIEDLKTKVCKEVDARADEIIEIAEKIYECPELGFKEYRTAELVERKFKELGIEYQSKLALTGVKGKLIGGSEGPTVAIIGELDAILVPDHPDANPTTGAVHACGHNCQIAAMLGAGIGLLDSGVIKELNGNAVLFAVPAEEYIELGFRMKLREEGKIEFLAGKQELIRLGCFDDIDMAMMVHAFTEPGRAAICGITTEGVIGKTCRFIGKASHAGSSPHEGINALNAAMMALMGIHVQRETFKDEDCIRVHGIITKGGDSVNVVPSDVQLELNVRGRTIDALMDANKKVDRAVKAGAMCVSADVEIFNMPGHMPIQEDKMMLELFKKNASKFIPPENIRGGLHFGWSSDMGDVTHIMPAIHPLMGGFSGSLHGKDFKMMYPEMACLVPAKVMAMSVVDLLSNKARLARKVLKEFKPLMTREQHDAYLRSLWSVPRK
jgi:amidohydrolase